MANRKNGNPATLNRKAGVAPTLNNPKTLNRKASTNPTLNNPATLNRKAGVNPTLNNPKTLNRPASTNPTLTSPALSSRQSLDAVINSNLNTMRPAAPKPQKPAPPAPEPHHPYVVRGARFGCRFGTHVRKLDMRAAHGIFIRGNAMMNEDDCVVGIDDNIPPFGGCESPIKDGKTVDVTVGPDDEAMPTGVNGETGELIFPEPGTVIKDVQLCEPELLSKWLDAEATTLVGGKPALTMKCHVICSHACQANGAARISFIDDGQDVD